MDDVREEMEATPEEPGGAGEVVEKRSLKLEDLVAEIGWGAANCVDGVVVDVVCGGGERLRVVAKDGAAAGVVADWKSSKSSSPLASVDDSMAPKSSSAVALPLEAGSSVKSKRSWSGSFFAALPASLLIVLTEAARAVGSFLRDELGAEAGASPASSYSSNLSPLLEVSEKLVS